MHSFMTTKEQNKLRVSEYTPQQISFEVFTTVTTVTNHGLDLKDGISHDFIHEMWCTGLHMVSLFNGSISLTMISLEVSWEIFSSFFQKTCFHHFIFHTFSIIFPCHIFPAFFKKTHAANLGVFVAPTASSV